MWTHRAAARALVAVTALLVGTVVSSDAGASVGGHSAAPRITSVSVRELNQGETTVAVVRGANFESGATVSIGPDVTSRVTSASSGTVTVRWTVAITAQVSARTLTVTNPGGASGADRHAVHVRYAPIFTQWAVGQGAADWSTTLVRPTFTKVPTLAFSGGGVTQDATRLNGAGQLVVAFTIARAASPTWRSMQIDDGLASWSVPHGLKVRAGPSLRSVTPLGQGATHQTVLVRGTGFESCKSKAPGLAISGSGVTINWVSDALGTLIYANLSVAPAAAIGVRDVTVTNCDTGGSVTAAAFAVLGPPSVASVAPIALGVSRVESVRGTNFTPDTTLAVSGTGVTVSAVHYVSPTKLRATLTVSPSAALGVRDVTADDTGGSGTTSTGVLSIDPLPTETSVTPGGAGANTTTTVTVHGTGFEAGATVLVERGAVRDAAVTAGSVVVTSATTLTAKVAARGSAGVASDVLEVVNPDGGTVSTLAFRTDPGPKLTGLRSSTTTQGVLIATFSAPSDAPSGETYTAKACAKGAKHLTCVTASSYKSGGAITGLTPGTRYYVVVSAASSGSYFSSASNLGGPAVATLRLTAPSITSVAPSTSKAGQVTVRFGHSANAPKSQRYTATACRNTAMTSHCVAHAGYVSGGQLTGLTAGGDYFVTVTAVSSSGYLAATSKASVRVLATVQLAAPSVTHTSYPGGMLEIAFAHSKNALSSQAYTATACRNAAMTSGCVAHQDYRSGAPFSGLSDASYYVRVKAVASSGYLAASSTVVEAVRS